MLNLSYARHNNQAYHSVFEYQKTNAKPIRLYLDH